MPPRRVIGIDAGGTKLLGGVVDEQMVVHHRVHRTWRGADRQETLDIFTDAVEEVRAAASGRRGDRLRRAGPGGAEDGRDALVQPPAGPGRRALPRSDERAARAAGGGGQRRERLDARGGAQRRRRGGAARGDGLARDRDRRRAARERRGVPGRDGRGRGARPRGAPATRARLPRRLPRPGLLRGARVGECDRARGAARRAGAAGLAARPPARRGAGDQRRRRDRAGA